MPSPFARWTRSSLLALVVATTLAACQTTPPPTDLLSPAQITALAQEGFQFADDGSMQLDLSARILFEPDSASPNANTRPAIDRLTQLLVSIAITSVRLDGHTDNTGSAAHNDALSLQRAQTVAALMVESGFNADAIAVRGLGPSRPIADNATPEGRAANRRVSVIVGSAP